MQDENGEKMEQEQSQEQGPPETATEETEKEAEPEKEHDAVIPGGKCSLCGWEFGNPDPHIVSFGALRNEPETPIVKPTVAVKESDPKACPPVSLQGGKCPKCGWSAEDPETRGNPHPVLL